MTRSLKDVAATVLTALAVLAYFATDKGWDVPLIGHSHRWAAGAIFLLGMMTCTLGGKSDSKRWSVGMMLLSVFGAAALVFTVVALITASLTVLLLLVVDIVLLWAGSTVRHLFDRPKPVRT